MIRIGTAGWRIPLNFHKDSQDPATLLERYAKYFDAVEINSSFYRPHKIQTYARWAASVPHNFRFSVKMPKSITHDYRLSDTEDLLDRFMEEIQGLGSKLGPILIQLPPSFAFTTELTIKFLDQLRIKTSGLVCCEPRHTTWFTQEADNLLTKYCIARVAADPAKFMTANIPGGWHKNFVYVRLHGYPQMYYSKYETGFITRLAKELKAHDAQDVWCIFDNTAAGAATDNAISLSEICKPSDTG